MIISDILKGFIRSNNVNPEAFAKAQDDCQKLVLATIPLKYKEKQRTQDKLQQMLDQKATTESLYSEEFNDRGLTPKYLNQRSNRRRVIFGATTLEGLATAITLNFMFGLQLLLALFLGLSIAVIVFFAASADKVAGRELHSKWTWGILVSYNLILAIIGVIIGILSEAEPIFMIVHVLLSVLSFIFILTALKYAEQYDHDKMISKVKVQYDELLSSIIKFQQNLEKTEFEMIKLMEELSKRAIDCYNLFQQLNNNPENLRFCTQTRLILNQVFHEDIFPIPQETRGITKPNDQDPSYWPEILYEFGTTQNRNNRPTIGYSNTPQIESLTQDREGTLSRNVSEISSSSPMGGNNSSTRNPNTSQQPEINNIPEGETEL